MPSSRHNAIPHVLHVVEQLQPRSILEIGVGFGKWGHLFREYTDIKTSLDAVECYHRENWRVRIDGIEACGRYITPAHAYLYDNLYIADATEKLSDLGRYDVIFLGDVIEHIDKARGATLLRRCLNQCDEGVIVTTPAKFTTQGANCGNPYEIHRSFWTARDFRSIGRCTTHVAPNNIRVAVLLADRIAAPSLRPVPLLKRLEHAFKRWFRPARHLPT